MADWMRKRGQRVPEHLNEPDEIYLDLLPIWTAWHELSMGRPAGFSPCGLPWSDMSRYCEDHGIDGPMRLRWLRLFQALEATYLTSQAEDSKAKREAARGSS